MRRIAERLAEQSLGRSRIAQCRQQEVDGGAAGIDRPIQVAPPPLYPNVSLIDPDLFVGLR